VSDDAGTGGGAIVFTMKTPALAEVRVRRALRHAIDIQALSGGVP
jgi:ABC-type transport system substrate-binding protein